MVNRIPKNLGGHVQGRRHHSYWGGQCPSQYSWVRGTGGYKIIRWSNSSHAL